MSFFAWLKSVFGAPPKRDISRLSVPDDLDAVEETVEISGGPIKEHHRRLGLRDKRLLPKAKSPARRMGITKRKTVMSVTEAERMFGGTMRTRNRDIRDLLTDEEQLKRYGLPIWKSEEDIANALGISLRELWFFSIHREKEQQPHYISFVIPKRSGGKRLIMAPKRRLKMILRKLLVLLVEKLPASEHAHAFRAGRSIRTGAEPHVGKQSLLKLDLQDFFPTVTFARIRGLLIAYGYSFPVASTLAVLMTEPQRQPVEVEGKMYYVPVGMRYCVQGAPTSPGLCNSVLLRLDRRLAGLAKKHALCYTRYADDMSFSGDVDRSTMLKFRAMAVRVNEEEGFTLNADKTRLMARSTRQTVTGVVVNKTLGLSRQQRRRIRAMIHKLKSGGAEGQVSNLVGKLAYLSMLNPEQAAPLKTKLEG